MKEVVLTNEELDIIDRLQNSQFPSAGYDPYEVWCNLLWSGVNFFQLVFQFSNNLLGKSDSHCSLSHSHYDNLKH